jgi:hypothetical protein
VVARIWLQDVFPSQQSWPQIEPFSTPDRQ